MHYYRGHDCKLDMSTYEEIVEEFVFQSREPVGERYYWQGN